MSDLPDDELVLTDYSMPFDTFWLEWGEWGEKGPKSLARKQYAKMRLEGIGREILLKQHAQWDAKQAIRKAGLLRGEEHPFVENFPHVHRWLRERRWEDD